MGKGELMQMFGKCAWGRQWIWGLAAAASLLMSAPVMATGGQDASPLSQRQRKAGDVVTVSVGELPAGLSVGPVKVKLDFVGSPGVDSLQLSYAVEGSLRVEASAPAEIRLDAQHHASTEIPLTVLASGLHYLHVHVRSGSHYSAFAVRIDAGSVQGINKTMRQSRQVQDGGFTEMPAQEKRRY